MAVIQRNKENKVRPVLDWREANSFIEAFTRDAGGCVEKLREWNRMGKRLLLCARLFSNIKLMNFKDLEMILSTKPWYFKTKNIV